MVTSPAESLVLTERFDLHGSSRWSGSRAIWTAGDRVTGTEVWLHLAACDDRHACLQLGTAAATRAMVQHPAFAPILVTGRAELEGRLGRFVAVAGSIGPTTAHWQTDRGSALAGIRGLLEGLQRLHRAGYAHGGIQPASVTVAHGTLVLDALPRHDATIEGDLAGVAALAGRLLPGATVPASTSAVDLLRSLTPASSQRLQPYGGSP